MTQVMHHSKVVVLRGIAAISVLCGEVFGQSPTGNLLPPPAVEKPGRVLPQGLKPRDTRLGTMKGERGDFSFVPSNSPEEWNARKFRVRQIMRVALGLWPMPTKTPLNPVVHGRRIFDEYTLEKVYFESAPGFFVTGNLYRPKGVSGKRPAVLSPHGHFPGGRFVDDGAETVRRKIVLGAERFEDGGRSFMQSRCVQLARMGCVVFHYDMIGYGDSEQIPLDVAHRFSGLRRKWQVPRETGFYSAGAELHLQNPMGLHTYNSIRALDFLSTLPDVDPKRIAVTGGSGGGTQTFMVCAVDDRPLVSVPVVIVSTGRQGGCTCENIFGFRIGTYNLEFTALHAPKPLLLVSADDDTRRMGVRGFPQLVQHYRLFGAEKNVAHVAFLQFPHNYNAVSRAAMYHWLNQHLQLGLVEPILERSYKRLTQNELSVWNTSHPRPESGAEFEAKLLEWFKVDAQQQLRRLISNDVASMDRMRHIVGGGWDVLLRGLPKKIEVTFESQKTIGSDTHAEHRGLLRYASIEGHRAELPMVQFVPREAKKRTVIWLQDEGKAGLYSTNGSLNSDVRRLVDAGSVVVGVDLLNQGEFLDAGRAIQRQRWLPGEEGYAGWTYCYNLPLFARRVHDILATIAFARASGSTDISLVGIRGAGPLVTAAIVQSRGGVDRAAIDTGGFRFSQVKDVYDVRFLPGAAKYLDLPGLLALAAPTRLWVAGENDESLHLVRTAYRTIAKSDHLTRFRSKKPTVEDVVKWLTAASFADK